jgi:hypothetical protein
VPTNPTRKLIRYSSSNGRELLHDKQPLLVLQYKYLVTEVILQGTLGIEYRAIKKNLLSKFSRSGPSATFGSIKSWGGEGVTAGRRDGEDDDSEEDDERLPVLKQGAVARSGGVLWEIADE